ncbi:MAG: hypothetical protein ACOYNS_17995, partial [Bacteroidota bacterium]
MIQYNTQQRAIIVNRGKVYISLRGGNRGERQPFQKRKEHPTDIGFSENKLLHRNNFLLLCNQIYR